MRLNQIYTQFADQVNFFCVYIKEAHPEDGWQLPVNTDNDIIFDQPKSMQERAEVAQACMLDLELSMPTLLDDIEDSTDEAYAALPERLYLVGRDGNVRFQCDPGPFGFDVDGWRAAIEAEIS